MFLWSCGQSGPSALIDRVAFLDIDNLTGDESLAWVADAVPAIASRQLAGVGKIVPLRGSSSREAVALRADRAVHGYFDRRHGKLHFEFTIEDMAAHSMIPVALDGEALEAAATIAKAIDAGAQPFSTANTNAVQAWAERNFAVAVELDPDFGTAWRDLAQSQKMPRPTVAAALQRPTLRTPLDRAQLELLAAQLDNDSDRIREAGSKLAELLPNEASLARLLAQQESNARRFPQAVQYYERAIRLEPDDPSQYNALGYAQFFAGDLAGARKTLDQYMKFPGQEANALDSQGEVLFMAGQFKDAEQYFQRAHAQNPALLGGGDLLKAAYAHWLAGDLSGADAIFKSYIEYLSQNNDSTMVWRTAIWEYSTGRQAQAVARLRGWTDATSRNQLLVWDKKLVLPDIEQLRAQYLKTPPPADGLIRTFYASALRNAGKSAEAEQLTKIWPLPESGDPLLQSLMYPIFLELKK